MDRILIVEDNKTLAKLIAKKLKLELDFEVDIAFSLQETKLFTSKYNYFLVLSDLNLPDAPNGEVIDYLNKKNCHVIVLSGNIDKELREKIIQKNIIDYFTKSGVSDINNIIATVKRLQNNQKHKILVVDDSVVFRKNTETMLKNLFYNVISVAHGEEAMGMLETNKNISLVLTDYNMPVMNGLELTEEIRQQYSKNDLSIIAISSSNDDQTTALFLKNGANDYIKKPFSKEEFTCRINNAIEALENIQTVTNHANRDFLTGLYNRRYFHKAMGSYMDDENFQEEFAVAMVNIDDFKKINDTYGHETGDKVIIHLSEILRTSTNFRDVVARFEKEEFCIVLKNINRYSARDIFERLRTEVELTSVMSEKNESIKFTISIGAMLHKDEGLEEALNQADMLLYKAKHEGKNQLLFDGLS